MLGFDLKGRDFEFISLASVREDSHTHINWLQSRAIFLFARLIDVDGFFEVWRKH